MTYPEPNGMDDIYGVGAERAEAFAEALDREAERATKAGVSYEAVIGAVSSLASSAELRRALERLRDGDFAGTPINKGSAAMMLIEEALSVPPPTEFRKEQCRYCGNYVSDWVDPDWAGGRICRECDRLHEPAEIAKAKSLYSS